MMDGDQHRAGPDAVPEPAQAAFMQAVMDGAQPEAMSAWARAAKAVELAALPRLAAGFAHAAFTAPEKIAGVYDAAATAWTGQHVEAPAIAAAAAPGEALPPAFWQRFWPLLADSARGIGAGEITRRTAALAGVLAPELTPRVIDACLAYPGVARAARAGFPGRITLEQLRQSPAGSVGEDFYRLLVDHDFDIEVLDRDALALAALPPPLDYLNARILQTHDLWHLTAGYETTKLHETALSAFQLAQFGHHYSAMFLALVTASVALLAPGAAPVLLDSVFAAWLHGRATPPMLLIPWESAWSLPLGDIRARYGVHPFASPYPANIIEMFEAAA